MNRIQRLGKRGSGDERVVIHPSRAKLALLSAGALAFVAAGVWMVFLGRIYGVLGIVFFGACAGYGIWRLVVPRALLLIDRQGIDDNASAVGGGRIPWSEITGCGVCAVHGQQMVGIGLVDPAAHLARLGPVKRRSVRFNLKAGLPPVMIPQNVLPLGAAELVAEIEWFRSQAFGR